MLPKSTRGRFHAWYTLIWSVCACAALAAFGFACVALGLMFLQIRQTAKVLPDVVHTEMESTRTFLGTQVSGLESQTLTLYDKVSGDIRFLANTTDRRLGKLESDTFTELANIRTDGLKVLDTQLGATNEHIGKLTTAYADIPKVVGARFDLFTDCQKNKLCLQGQASDTLFAIRSTSRDVSGMVYAVNPAVTSMAASFQSSAATFNKGWPTIVANVGGITGNINALTKPRWYDRLIGYSLNGVVIYRNLNPATNLTVKGAQFIASQK